MRMIPIFPLPSVRLHYGSTISSVRSCTDPSSCGAWLYVSIIRESDNRLKIPPFPFPSDFPAPSSPPNSQILLTLQHNIFLFPFPSSLFPLPFILYPLSFIFYHLSFDLFIPLSFYPFILLSFILYLLTFILKLTSSVVNWLYSWHSPASPLRK